MKWVTMTLRVPSSTKCMLCKSPSFVLSDKFFLTVSCSDHSKIFVGDLLRLSLSQSVLQRGQLTRTSEYFIRISRPLASVWIFVSHQAVEFISSFSPSNSILPFMKNLLPVGNFIVIDRLQGLSWLLRASEVSIRGNERVFEATLKDVRRTIRYWAERQQMAA